MRSIPVDALVQMLTCTLLPLLSLPAFVWSLIYALLWHSWLRLGVETCWLPALMRMKTVSVGFSGKILSSRKKECFQLNALDNKLWGAEIRLSLLELIVSKIWSQSSIQQESKPWSAFSNDIKKSNKRCYFFKMLLFIYVSACLPVVQSSLGWDKWIIE